MLFLVKNLMTHQNEQSETTTSGSPGLWGTEETGQCDNYGDGSQSIRSNGIPNQYQSFGAGRTTGEGNRECEEFKGETGSGKKLIDQLEDFFGGYLAYVESHEERLKARLDANLQQQKTMKEQFEGLKQSLLQLVDTDSEQ